MKYSKKSEGLVFPRNKNLPGLLSDGMLNVPRWICRTQEQWLYKSGSSSWEWLCSVFWDALFYEIKLIWED
jgi:hypothetical protein